MRSLFHVENLGCWACSVNIAPELIKLIGVYSTSVNVIEGTIEVNHTEEVNRHQISMKLREIGYPEIQENDQQKSK
ncbi:MAG: heavy-metal-associated domain-containing protein [Bacteroidales bacterium]